VKAAGRVGTLAATLLAAAGAACVHIEQRDYPKEWPPVAPAAAACPDLTGEFANADLGGSPVPLARWVVWKTTYPLERIERIRLAGPVDGEVTLRLIDGAAAEVALRRWKFGAEYRCENGWLVHPLDGYAMPVPAIGGSAETRFARTVDGQLIVERSSLGGGVAIVMPLISAVRTWHRYPPAAN
jgi:hypothetical protein